jgi:natural product precursor
MKKNSARKGKLTLNRETLRALESRDLATLVGGAISDVCPVTTGSENCATSLGCPPVNTRSHNTCGSAYC